MYDNSKIKWLPGMEFTAEVFQHQDADLDRRQQLTVRTSIGNGLIGLLPDCAFHAEGSFVDRTYEMVGLQCTALLSSGRIITVDDTLSVDIPKLGGDEVFVCLGIKDGEVHDFERDGIPYEGPVYALSVHKIDEIESEDLMPVKRMVIADGMLNIDSEYIVPTLSLSSDKRILEHRDRICQNLLSIINHPKLPVGDAKRELLHTYMLLKNITARSSVSYFTNILRELALAVEFYIIEEIGKSAPSYPDDVVRLNHDTRREYNQLNFALYMQWLEEYLAVQPQLLDIYVPKELEIDFSKFKAELKAELTQELSAQLYEQLKNDLTTAITEDLANRLTATIQQRIDELHPELATELHQDLHDPLYHDLYDALLAELSKLSFKPDEGVIDTFVPLI